MRKLALFLLAASAGATAQIGWAQSVPPTADDYVCALSGDCGEEEAEEATPAPATNTKGGRLNATRGFSLSAPRARPAPAATNRPAPRTTPRPAPRQTASVNRPTRPAPAQAGRVDLRLSFGNGSAELTPAARQQIQAFAEALKRPQLATARVRIEGHTDSSGARTTNLTLSQRRAQSVADFLVTQGVPAARLDVKGFGPDKPLNGKSASSPDNRRVEAVRIS